MKRTIYIEGNLNKKVDRTTLRSLENRIVMRKDMFEKHVEAHLENFEEKIFPLAMAFPFCSDVECLFTPPKDEKVFEVDFDKSLEENLKEYCKDFYLVEFKLRAYKENYNSKPELIDCEIVVTDDVYLVNDRSIKYLDKLLDSASIIQYDGNHNIGFDYNLTDIQNLSNYIKLLRQEKWFEKERVNPSFYSIMKLIRKVKSEDESKKETQELTKELLLIYDDLDKVMEIKELMHDYDFRRHIFYLGKENFQDLFKNYKNLNLALKRFLSSKSPGNSDNMAIYLSLMDYDLSKLFKSDKGIKNSIKTLLQSAVQNSYYTVSLDLLILFDKDEFDVSIFDKGIIERFKLHRCKNGVDTHRIKFEELLEKTNLGSIYNKDKSYLTERDKFILEEFSSSKEFYFYLSGVEEDHFIEMKNELVNYVLKRYETVLPSGHYILTNLLKEDKVYSKYLYEILEGCLLRLETFSKPKVKQFVDYLDSYNLLDGINKTNLSKNLKMAVMEKTLNKKR
jgi:hypothetical protein